ncbi:hypothetical protein THAOC_18515 [Thalassiosira oceanica]|uniref:Uncharacterized protein n=1 Tax=Thalassiosira oceanica TaxID=159749 RepID=K0SJ70_THAOC|nr:hypothetical protein THAOC_18515 [Thalassiosira oceanica]|mmetsp:Transcript_479/g.1068  ORF Transcript_479/g.1068 Transcript_479/m.1068 type:complete len:252 (+) Transcript_479:81-836(+)|eukprot:EJK61051.1 hypothetical protein THAOC_18515 [Thalassiosira oceanica]
MCRASTMTIRVRDDQSDAPPLSRPFESKKRPASPTIPRPPSPTPERLLKILSLIASRHWQVFDYAYLQNPERFRDLVSAVDSTPALNGMTVLHMMVRHAPPTRVLARAVEICPDMCTSTDALGRTPLHVAAVTGDVSAIKFLAETCPEACSLLDADEKTPLIILCDVDAVLFAGDGGRDEPPSFELVQALLVPNLDAVVVEDATETNAVEYAILSGCERRTVRLLQRASQDVMKKSRGETVHRCMMLERRT